MKDLYAVGETPPLGEVPARMYACTVRQDRYGPPISSMQTDIVPVPEVGDDEVLVFIMAAGINYNNIWVGRGVPIDVIAIRKKKDPAEEDFHIGGSDASGIVYKVGKNVTHPKVGDEVVLHPGAWDVNCPMIQRGVDPMYSPTFHIWGYELNWGSFAQFAKVQPHQCLPRPQHLSWAESATYIGSGATAYRMLLGWTQNTVKKGMPVLIWGAAGGLGSMAIQICKAVGAIPVGVVSDDSKFEYCIKLGAKGCVNRNDFSHWGMLPHWTDKENYDRWVSGARAFGKAVRDVIGSKQDPAIVIEHPGENTIPTSMFVCETGGMVTICAGTTGFNATVDLRYLWMRQKRLQGSHFANDVQAHGINNMIIEGRVDPCMSEAFSFEQIPHAHQLMFENRHPNGNMAILIGATDQHSGRNCEKPQAPPI